ncbi:MAG TPA: hypothetical protein VHW25_15175 [Steroidobacteraceae bacterium]|jgi:hypothetical protein|nr:hypothetical protein [Steroidobacteraceae bacterium]
MSRSITRRGVLAGAAAIAGVSALPPLLAPTRSAIGHVVVDERLTASVAFGGGFRGPDIHPVSALDDLCNRWYTRLRREVLANGAHIAGLTSWIDYVVMRSCAAEIGYRSAFHTEHPPGAQLWPQALGEALAAGAHLRSRFQPARVFGATTSAVSTGHMRLVTWVFAPRN